MPSSSGGSVDEASSQGASSQGSSGASNFLKKKRSFGLKKAPFKPKTVGRVLSGGKKTPGTKQQDHDQQLQQLDKIIESSSPSPTKSTSGAVEVVLSPPDANVKNKEDNAFLRALRGSTSLDEEEEDKGPNNKIVSADVDVGGATSLSNVDDDANMFLRNLRGDGFGGTEIMPSQSKIDTQDDFLRNLQGSNNVSNSNPSSGTLTNTTTRSQPQSKAEEDSGRLSPLSNADVDFLAAMRGTPEPTQSSQSGGPSNSGGSVSSMESSPSYQKNSQEILSNRVALASSNMPTLPAIRSSGDMSEGGGGLGGPNNEIDHANAAFLGALHAASAGGGEGNNVQGKSYPDGSFIMTPPSRLQQAKQRMAAGKQAKKEQQQNHAKPPQSSSVETDSEFLMAVRGSQFGSTTSNAGGFDSGTLVLNSSEKKSERGYGAKNNNDVESSNAAFMMSIRASGDDNGEATINDGSNQSQLGGEGETITTTNQSKVSIEEDDDTIDEDIEGYKLPTQPYMEKVLLPRPLFFGYQLSPRVTAEAERAAELYTTPTDFYEMEIKEEDPAVPPPDSPHVDNTESSTSNADDSSVVSNISLSSLAGAGGRRLESNIQPCCRNFEGAIEAFGFGVNPFRSNFSFIHDNKVDNDNTHNHKDTEDTNDELSGPHPYVSIYSPVWEEWAMAARAKARRKKGRFLDAQAAAEEAEARAKQEESINTALNKQQQESTRSSRRKHKKSMSMDFMDSLRQSSAGEVLPSSESTTRQTKDLQTSFNTVNTAALSSTSSSNETSKADSSANDMFLQYARAGSVEGVVDVIKEGDTTTTKSPQDSKSDFSQDQFLKYARAGAVVDEGSGTFVGTPKASQDTNNKTTNDFQDMFLQYARAGSADGATTGGASGTFVGGQGTFVSSKPSSVTPSMDSSTFVQAVKSSDGVDDDEIVAAEERTTVGLNDNISAAAAMLAGNGGDDDDADVTRGIDTSMFLAAGGGVKSANKYGRPYSNYELTGGCTPKYGCDDPSLPHESDLGVFETKEEEKRSAERRRERNMIEDFAVPGIMPHITCPTYCSDVDDCTSYNSRQAEHDSGSKNNTILISLDGESNYPDNGASVQRHKSPLYEASRIAWWNLPDSYDGTSIASNSDASNTAGISSDGNHRPASAAEVFPAMDDPIPLDVQTGLWPSMKLLRENNMSGSRSHPATSTARFVPHLSDRPPSVRHLQIDTTAVGFPKIGGEIEPMFCKLAIYHFEMSAEKISRMDSDSVSTNTSSAPSPNLERCGRVTEILSFDIVQDLRVIQKCKDALWPYANNDVDVHGTSNLPSDDPQTEGTSCGMFPLPANLSISNLYAVIIVEKVMAESSDMKPYYKPSRHEPATHEETDLATLRANAAKACEQYGQFTTPFAFGVVPLKHIIGDESPKVPVSRAVQIPLFKFDPERGPQSIFDHIFLMLHPRAEPRGGKTASMTRGHALLVMRYFGYLGLHSVLKTKSSLARERLVDFQGELQLRCKGNHASKKESKEKCPVLGENYILPPWRSQYEVEPAPFGGRNVVEPELKIQGKGAPKSLYAQEVAPLPLERSVPESSRSSSRKSANRSKYDGMLLHTSFCNELVCQPKLIQNCSKKNIIIKVTLREVTQYDETLNSEVALPVAPSIHNTRRGPWLVQEAFSSCMGTPQFLDDFKIKLPLVLGTCGQKRYGLLFTLYHFKILKKKRRGSLVSSLGGTGKPESDYSVEQIGSGFLPLALENSPTCLIPNGDHDVPINYRAVCLDDGKEMESSPPLTSKHKKRLSFDTIGRHARSWSSNSDALVESQMSQAGNEGTTPPATDEHYPEGSLALTRLHVQAPNEYGDDTQDDNQTAQEEDDASLPSTSGSSMQRRLRSALSSGDSKSLGSQANESSLKDSSLEAEMILKVTIVAFTSVHPQNKTLAELFLAKPMLPRCLMPSDFTEAYAPWGKNRSEILYRLKPERIPPFMFVGGYLAETERKLLEPVVSLTKSSKCPHSDLMTHLIRVVAQLWRTAVSGAGEPSILWASPDALIPLRLNAFATLLHTVSSASHHMAKAGLRQLDGNAPWDITALGKLLSMVFDEWALFGGPLEKPIHVKSNKPTTLDKPKVISSRAKTVDISKASSRPSIIERYSSEESPKNSLVKTFDVDAMLKANLSESGTSNVDSGRRTSFENDSNLTSGEAGFAVDSKSDFMSALTASLDADAADSSSSNSGSSTSESLSRPMMTQGPAANRRRWNTLPLNALSTIQENDTEDIRSSDKESLLPTKKLLSLKKDDSELVLHPEEKKKKSKQFRVPEVKPTDHIDPFSSFIDDIVQSTENEQKKEVKDPQATPEKQRTLPTNDEDIETAGTAFLDAISKSIGFGNGLVGKETGGEERRVGAAHHRKTMSRCSIDWSLPPTDKLIEKDQRIEELNRTRSGLSPSIIPLSPGSLPDGSSSEEDDTTTGNDSSTDGSSHDADNLNTATLVVDGEAHFKKEHPLKRHRRSLSKDENKPLQTIVLPDFADRISAMKNNGAQIRWWPYVYEIIIYQWVALLDEQTKKGDSAAKRSEESKKGESSTGLSLIVVKYLSNAAKAARGATIRCAPFLLEIIKQSLSWRVDCVFRNRKKNKPSLDESSCENSVPPLIKLDENLMAAVEKLITMLTDASIDSRNFDSFEYRKISIDVNTAVVKFIRDLFSILDVQLVHRLVMVYFSRFVTKEGKHWHDRDSKVTGLRCSWETTKLRLNAITIFVRFPAFMTVCSPILESWVLPAESSADAARRFFSDALEKINRLGLSEFTASDGPVRKEPISIPRMKPHWLAELCTDICLSATGHAEEKIRIRASSLLFELFWRHSQQGRYKGNVSVVASVFMPFVPKILSHMDYLSSLPAKCQLRKDILPCALFVLQSAPTGILRALWRKLAKRAEGKSLKRDSADKYGGIVGSSSGINCNVAFSSLLSGSLNEEFELDEEADIFYVFGLLNLSLSTIEYEGSANQVEDNVETGADDNNEKSSWRREFLLSSHVKTTVRPSSRPFNHYQSSAGVGEVESAEHSSTSDSRMWHAHDCSITIVNICRQIVREILGMLKPNLTSVEDTSEGDDWDSSYAGVTGSRSMSDIFLQPTTSSLDDNDAVGAQHDEGKAGRMRRRLRKKKIETLNFAVTDTIIFVRAAASVYLHALSMKQSDVVIAKTLTAAVEIVKIFGVKLFLAAVGETLQHWMRVILEHCGARRAELRVDACEFLNLLLRLTWESYGSFTRVRLPLLAVQSEVMERIVAKAARKYVAEQRRLGLSPVELSNDSAEASLTPLWRTIDRLHNQSASSNLSFKSALARLAIKMKRVYRAYLAAHALAIVNRSETGNHAGDDIPSSHSNPYVQRMRVSVHRIVSNSTWFSKRFLGNQTSLLLDRSMIQTEAVEDSFLIAADVFSSTELPSHRVAWLQKLAEFHRMRGRFAEEATCRCNIYHTYREAAKQHDHIWSSSPFLPWATHPDGEGHAIVSEFDYEESLSGGSGKQLEKGSAFRRIFYRAADSVRVRTGDWGAVSGGKYLFYGVTLKSEFDSVSPWYSYREMEENMVEEAETSGELYLRAGIVESSRYAWSLANEYYSETFNYARLAFVYRKLALVVTSQVPIIDVSNQLDLSSQLGRFYKVYFHGSAPDDLLHSQGSEGFIYRVPNSVQIKDFASRLESAIRCILPSKTTIDLLLDDGSPTMAPKSTSSKRPTVIGGAPSEPVKIKVTPLRPLFKIEDNEKCFRGTPEWFQLKTEEQEYDANAEGSGRNSIGTTLSTLHKRSLSTSTANSLSSAGSVTMSKRTHSRSAYRKSSTFQHNSTHEYDMNGANGELIGVDRFYFTQPMKKDPMRGFRDWLKVPKGRIAERSLRVTELQVENSFPACITRQKIIHRAVFTQSPLEASVEAVSTWCSVLFRTVIATNGQGVLGGHRHQGLSGDSAKLVMECIHSSGVKRIGFIFLSVNATSEESNNQGAGMYSPYETLDEDEIERVQTKLARMIVTFLELLHLLIARNRDVLLTVVQARKRRGGDASSVASGSIHGYASTPRAGSFSPMKRHREHHSSEGSIYGTNNELVGRSILAEAQAGHVPRASDRTDNAIGVQSELQRGLISLVKYLSPSLLDTLNNEVPRWMRSCCQDNYFSSGLYRQAVIPIGDELFFNVDTSGDDDRGSKSESSYTVPRSITRESVKDGSPSGSLCSQDIQFSLSDQRRIDRTQSITSERPPSGANHRRTISGASYASSSRPTI